MDRSARCWDEADSRIGLSSPSPMNYSESRNVGRHREVFIKGWRVIAGNNPMEEKEKSGHRSRMKQREMYKGTRSDRSNVHRPLASASYRHPGAESRSRSRQPRPPEKIDLPRTI
ncbi:hypothetical protein HN011_003220 [Eciton burchellii]|nr:hypothetical protein HN011_003220 [Eciton burchellii]